MRFPAAFGYFVDDEFQVFSYNGLNDLGPDWSGVCHGDSPHDFWYVGRDPISDERTLTKLGKYSYERALEEASVFERSQRLRAGAATVESFQQAVCDLFNGDPAAVMERTEKFSPCTSQEALAMTQASPAFLDSYKQQLAELRVSRQVMEQRSMTEDVTLDDWASLQMRQDEVINAFADALVDCKGFCGLTSESATQRWVLAPSAKTPGAWQITVFSPKDMPWGDTVYGDMREAIVQFLEDGDCQNVQSFHEPIKTSDAACTVQDTLCFMVDKIPAGKEVPVLMRELCKRHSEQAFSPEVMSLLVDQLKGWGTAPRGTSEFQVHHEAARRASLSHGPVYDQHLFAYAVEEAVGQGIKPNTMAHQGSVEEWLSQVEGVADRFYKNLSGEGAQLDAQDLVDFAYAMSQMDSPSVSCDVRRILQESRTRVEAGLSKEKVFGYYVMRNDRGAFMAEVRDASGSVIREVRGGQCLAEGEDSLVGDLCMDNFYDLKSLKSYMISTGDAPKGSVLLMADEFEQALSVRKEPVMQRQDESLTLG